MKSTETVRIRVSPGANGELLNEAFRKANPDDMSGNAWSTFLERARSCDADAYQDLYLRLKRFRGCFTRHIFVDPEGAYCEFVTDLVDQVRYGFLPNPQSLFTQARASAMRKAAERIRCLTMAARVLSTIPKRHREVLIRAELALHSTAHLVHDSHGARLRTASAPIGPRLGARPISTAPKKAILLGTYRSNYGTPAAVA
jgi:hypothetical protein